MTFESMGLSMGARLKRVILPCGIASNSDGGVKRGRFGGRTA